MPAVTLAFSVSLFIFKSNKTRVKCGWYSELPTLERERKIWLDSFICFDVCVHQINSKRKTGLYNDAFIFN